VSPVGRLQDQKHGPGLFQFSNGSAYRGHFQFDEQHGHGEVLYVNGNSYSGNFVNGVRSGRGFYRWANGDQYEGLWESNDVYNLVCVSSCDLHQLNNSLDDQIQGVGSIWKSNGDWYEVNCDS